MGKKEKSEVSKNGGKVFINICWDPNVAKPESRQAVDGSTGKCGVRWSVPYCQSRPRQETDSKGVPCDVYDVIFHPEAGILASKDPRMKDLLNTTAVDAIEKAFGITLDRKNLKSPKLKYKGHFRPTVIREAFGSKLNPSTELNPQNNVVDTLPDLVQEHQASDNVDAEHVKEPEYTLKYKNTHLDLDPAPGNILSSSDPCRPTELVVEIYLPEKNSAKGVDLDVLERQLTLNCMEPQPYHLDLRLPYPVDEESGAAKFDKSTRMLIVTLPVKPGQPQKPVVRVVSTDSGIGLDMEEKQPSANPISNSENVHDDLDNNQKDEKFEHGSTEKVLLPNYTCNMYENLMVFKLDVKNVDPDSVVKDALILNEGQEKGFSLNFVNIGSGMVPMKYGFNMALVFDEIDSNYWKDNRSILEDMEVEVWDNNIIVQLALPRNCKNYKVGTCISDMKDYPLNHPLRTFKKKMGQLKNSKSKIDGDVDSIKKTFNEVNSGSIKNAQNNSKKPSNNVDEQSSEEEKERHSSGESVDSFFSESPPSDSESETPNGEEIDQYDDYVVKNLDQDSIMKAKHVDNLESDNILDKLDSINETDRKLDSHDVEKPEDGYASWDSTNYGQPRGILKRCVRRCFSESHATSQMSADNLAWSNAIFDAISGPAPEDSSSSSSTEDNRITEDVTVHKKSVRFNEVVQRQIFRSNSSILKQKRKSEKRNEQRLRKRGGRGNMAVERRVSEGDAEGLLDAGFKLSSSFEKSILDPDSNCGYSSSENGSVSPTKNNAFEKFNNASKDDIKPPKASIPFDDNDSHTDSGVASSYDEHGNNSPISKNMEKIPEETPNENSNPTINEATKPSKKTKKNKKNKLTRGKSQQQGQFIKESNSDLIFDLDF